MKLLSIIATATALLTPTAVASFRLRLHWEKGVTWQGSDKEEFYCMEVKGKVIKLADCGGSSDQKFDEKGRTIRPASGGNKDDCFTKVGSKSIELKECDGSKDQDWDMVGGKTFEIYNRGDRKKCMTNHHHPRPGELIKLQKREKPRKSDTSLWVKY